MSDRSLPSQLQPARRTPLFDRDSVPPALLKAHRTSVWAELHVQIGRVRYVDLEGESPRDEWLDSGDHVVVPPDVEHRVELSTDAAFSIQFFTEPDAAVVPAAPSGE